MDQSTSTPNRPRTQSRASAWSHRSDKSNNSKPKETGPIESPADKRRRDSFWKGTSKANPNAALAEAQPGELALQASTIESLRLTQHKDGEGNVISDPDLSNPTRSRWERPLDTIRSFDKNIEAGYKRRSVTRSESYDPRENAASRRSSSYNGYENRYSSAPPNNTQYHGGYYGAAQRRPDGLQDDGSSPMAPPSRNRFNQRMGGPMSRSHSSYTMNGAHSHVGHDSYDAGMNSDSTGPWNYSTDPSSENSSIDRAHAVGKPQTPQPMEGYGYDGYGGAPIMEEYDSGSDGYGMSRRTNGNNRRAAAPTPQQSAAPAVRAPIKLGGDAPINSQGGSLPSMSRRAPVTEEKEEKKKGFFKKRFSKA